MKIAFISDIHSNLEALKAVLNKIQELKIRDVFCLGDICGYGSQPSEVIKTVKGVPCLMGNHDFAVVTKDTAWFNPYAAQAIEWTYGKLKEEDMIFLSNLRHRFLTNTYGFKLYMVHGSPDDPLYGYVYEEDALMVENIDCDVLALGHTHIPYIKKVGNKLVINAGSVGQPRDGNPKSSFAVLDVDEMRAEIVRVEYDIEAASKKILDAGLPPILAKRLKMGV